MFLSWTPLPPGNFPLGKCLTHTVNGEQRKRFTVVQPFSLPLVKTMFHCEKHSPHHLLLTCVTYGAKVHRFWHDKCCPCPHHPSLLCPKGSVAVSSWMWSASCRSLPVTSTTLCTFSLCQQSCSSTWARSPTPSRSEAYWEMLRRTCRYSNWSSPPPNTLNWIWPPNQLHLIQNYSTQVWFRSARIHCQEGHTQNIVINNLIKFFKNGGTGWPVLTCITDQ